MGGMRMGGAMGRGAGAVGMGTKRSRSPLMGA